jgi:hypothetical protein
LRSALHHSFHAGGTNNSSFNGRTTSWQKRQRIKKRVVKKAVGAKAKHTKTVLAVSGKRTGKSQRKAERRERRLEKEKSLVESGMDVDGEKKNTEKSLGLALKKVGAGKKVYSKLLPSSSSKKSKSREGKNDEDLMLE